MVKVYIGLKFKVPDINGVFTVVKLGDWSEAAKTGIVRVYWERAYDGGIEKNSSSWRYGDMPNDYIQMK